MREGKKDRKKKRGGGGGRERGRKKREDKYGRKEEQSRWYQSEIQATAILLQLRLTGHKTAVPRPHHSPQTVRDTRHSATVNIPYSAKFSGVFNFVNFANFQLFVKIFQRKFLTSSVRCARAASSRNYFTKSSKIAIRENLDPRKFSAMRYFNVSVL